MIDKKLFARGMDELRACHPHIEVTPAMVNTYYVTISPEMNDEQWKTAVKLSRRYDKHWPSPADLLTAHNLQTLGGFTARAHLMFSKIAENPQRTSSNYPYWDEKHIRATYGDMAADAFLIAGGAGVFSEMQSNETSIPHVRRAYVEAFVEKLKHESIAALPQVEAIAAR